MEKLSNVLSYLKTKISGINIAMLGFIAYTVKLITINISFADAIVFASLCCLYGYNQYLKSKAPNPIYINELLSKEISNIHSQINALKMEKNLKTQTKRYF